VVNKVDLRGAQAGRESSGQGALFHVSALRGDGMAELRAWLLEVAGWKPHGEGVFMARQRHLDALARAAGALGRAAAARAYELQAEELRLAHAALGEIVGNVSADQLLGEIFSRFCIGK